MSRWNHLLIFFELPLPHWRPDLWETVHYSVHSWILHHICDIQEWYECCYSNKFTVRLVAGIHGDKWQITVVWKNLCYYAWDIMHSIFVVAASDDVQDTILVVIDLDTFLFHELLELFWSIDFNFHNLSFLLVVFEFFYLSLL